MDVQRAHTPTWTAPSDWAAGPGHLADGHDEAADEVPATMVTRLRKTPGHGHRRAYTQNLENLLPTPRTTNVLAAADKTHLRKTSRKLERVLGQTPVIVLDDRENGESGDEVLGGEGGLRRRTTVTGHGEGRVQGRKHHHLPWQSQRMF